MKFAEQVTAWTRQTEKRMTAVYRLAIEKLAEDMSKTYGQGGRVPFETGNLANSILASTHGMPKTSLNLTQGSDVGAVTATLNLNQTVWLGYQAVYARRMNYGFVGADRLGRVYNQDGHYFLEHAMARWPLLVRQAAQETQQTVESRNASTTA